MMLWRRMDYGGGRRRVASIPPRRKDGSGLFPDFDYATNIRATGEFYHTSARRWTPNKSQEKMEKNKLVLHNQQNPRYTSSQMQQSLADGLLLSVRKISFFH